MAARLSPNCSDPLLPLAALHNCCEAASGSTMLPVGALEAANECAILPACDPFLDYLDNSIRVAGQQRLSVQPQAGKDARAIHAFAIGEDVLPCGKVEPVQFLFF